ncbi:RCC1 and BTB domain-containing protein 2-like [Oppia nitens]|uniref:RCC1 and BTB domain-containing protein 2-like n=1 Tax=Oppia nitens TaxID=1686743 RepID=UPI0023DA8981|nr:RCC1 and BTB domain-containing protein 2-like [Oppia nitens]
MATNTATIAGLDSLKFISCLKLLKPIVTRPEIGQRLRVLAIFGERGTSTICVTTDDQVYGLGDNRYGCLGVGRWDKLISEPIALAELCGKQVANIYYGFGHCIALTAGGQLWTWGENDFGQLGLGTFDATHTPKLIQRLASKRVVTVSCGNRHSLALTTDGELFGWGRNTFGQIGDMTYCWRVFPTRVALNEPVRDISCGKCHSLALTTGGRVYVWGLNDFGQLGRHRDVDVRAGKERALSYRPELVAGFETTVFVKAVCGPNHTMLLTADGQLYSFGLNDWGQIGNGTQKTQFTPYQVCPKFKWRDIVSTYDNNCSLGLTSDGTYYCWGYPYHYKKVAYPHKTDIQSDNTIYDIYTKYSQSFRTFRSVVFNQTKASDNSRLTVASSAVMTNNNNKENGFKQSINGEKLMHSNDINDNLVPKKRTVSQITTTTDRDSSVNGFADNRNHRSRTDSTVTLNGLSSTVAESAATEDTNNGLTANESLAIFGRHLSAAFNNSNNYDLVFVFTGELIYCHKTVLKIRSKRFWQTCDKYLEHNSNSGHLIYIKSYSYTAFYAFIQFLYAIQPEITLDTCADIVKLATMYDEPELELMCQQITAAAAVNSSSGQQRQKTTIIVENVCQIYETAIAGGDSRLEKSCIEFVNENLKDICRSNGFLSMDNQLSKRLMKAITCLSD